MTEPITPYPLPEDQHGPAQPISDQQEVIAPVVQATQGSSKSGLARFFAGVWRIYRLNTKTTIGFSIVLFFILVGILGPIFVPGDPNALSNDILLPPTAGHLLGTTQTGQDILTQLVNGTRISIFWGLFTGAIVTVLSILIGLTAGYMGGLVDDLLTILINVFLVLPGFPLAIVLAAYVPARGPITVALVIALTSWAYNARVLRAQTLSMKNRDFVEASKASGESTFRILFFEIFPNEIAIVASAFVSTMIYVILAAAGLEFLGLGDVTVVDWGTMSYWAQNNDALLLGAWWWYVAPGLCIAVLGAGLALINFGIDEIANPRLRVEKGTAPKAARGPFGFLRRSSRAA